MTYIYADTWEEFWARIDALGPKYRRTLIAMQAIDEKLAMIHFLSGEVLERRNAVDRSRRIQYAANQAAEEERMTIRGENIRDYTGGYPLPPITVRKNPRPGQQRDRVNGYTWWARLQDRAPKPPTPWGQWSLLHPYGPAVSQADLDALAGVFRAIRGGVLASAITPERALAIAMQVRRRTYRSSGAVAS